MPAARSVIGVAIAIPEPYGSELQKWREHFGDPMARSIPTHVTLLAPTEVTADGLGAVDEHLRNVAAGEAPFRMRLLGSATFRPASPVVFVQVAQGIGDCERIERKVRRGPLRRGLRFPYHPHVTVTHDLPDSVLDAAFDGLADYSADFTVPAFGLYEHGLDGVWRIQREYPLGRS